MPLSELLKFRRPERLTLEEYFAKLKEKGLNKDGTPVLDPTPMAPPIGYKKTPSMVEIVRDMVRGERLRQEALESGHETFEEAEDFDVGDEPDQLRSPYENDFDPPLTELVKAGSEVQKERQKQLEEAGVPRKTAKKAVEEPAGEGDDESGGAGGSPPA